MKTPYLLQQEALDAFLECLEPVKVTMTYNMPGYDIWDTPSEIFEATEEPDAEDDAEDDTGDDTGESSQEGQPDSDGKQDSQESAQSDDSTDDSNGDADSDDESDNTADSETDDTEDAVEDVAEDETSAEDVNAGSDDPTSVSAKQLLAELTTGEDNIYTRVANAAKDRGATEVTVKQLLPIIALGIKKFMKNKNYASLSKVAMKALVMNIANTMAHPKKKDEQQAG